MKPIPQTIVKQEQQSNLSRPSSGTLKCSEVPCPLALDPSGTTLGTYRFTKNGFDVFEEPETGLLFVYPLPTQEQLNKIYSEAYFERGKKYVPPAGDRSMDPQRLNDERKLRLLERYQAGTKLLDVGSAMGGFMQVASDAGYQVAGVEVSAFGAEYTRTELGLPVYNQPLPEIALPSESYDTVTMWDVIEHLRDPHQYLAEVSRITRPNGLMFVATGDVSARYARLMGRRWHLLTPPQHLFYFTPASLTRAIEANGFEVLSISWPGKYASLDFALFKARESFGRVLDPVRAFARWTGIARLRLYVNLWDIMTVVARKK
jgi:SAM-dependent methyltransferase